MKGYQLYCFILCTIK
uniref:Uncharacterized protein n=1 Tax=Arundo donax TaxID=35708 RepID=A0A0A9EGV5_ARUDO